MFHTSSWHKASVSTPLRCLPNKRSGLYCFFFVRPNAVWGGVRRCFMAGLHTIVHFKRLGSRHIHKEIEIYQCAFGFNEILCETGLKPNSDTYTQLQNHQRRTLWSNMKSDYVSLWYTQFRKLRASKESVLHLCNDTEFHLHLVILNTLYRQLPFHSTLVTRRPYLGHDNWRLRYRFFPF